MEINLKDAVRFNWGFQSALQGADTPNQAGIDAFLPIANIAKAMGHTIEVDLGSYSSVHAGCNRQLIGRTERLAGALSFHLFTAVKIPLFHFL